MAIPSEFRLSQLGWLLGCVLALAAFDCRTADFIMMTAPAQPVAGQPWSLVFAASTAGGRDLNPATSVEVAVVGDRVRIRPRAECLEIFCDVLSDAVFRAEVPALPAGRYTVEVVSVEQEDIASARPFTVEVVAGPEPVRLRPVDGFWHDPMRPGRGLALSLRGDTMGIGAFDMQPRPTEYFEPIWQLDAPILHGNSLVAALRRARTQLSDPSCLGCPAAQAPELLLSTFPIRLRFESERRAWMDLGDGTTRPLVSLPFGVPYIATTLTDTVDAEFGTLPLPDLQGRWLFDLPQGAEVVQLSTARVEAGHVVFSAAGFELGCASATPMQAAGCTFQVADASYLARLGDISDSRMLFRAATTSGPSFYAERLPSR